MAASWLLLEVDQQDTDQDLDDQNPVRRFFHLRTECASQNNIVGANLERKQQ
jgi:hypothetical protein